MDCELRSKCSVCGSGDLQVVMPLGEVPLSNAFLDKPTKDEKRYPLTLMFCPECSLVQLKEIISPDILFGNYVYFSSQSQTMLEHSRQLAEELIRELNLDKWSLVVEPASNDGYLLKHFQKAGIPVLGIEPAKNIADMANSQGIPTFNTFFGEKIGESLEHGADALLALNVLGHVKDLPGFARGIKGALRDSGMAVIEVPYVRDMVEDLAWDTIYHEHLSYFSMTSLVNLFKWAGLQVVKVRRIPIHCGSLRVYITHPKPSTWAWDRTTEGIWRTERQLGIDKWGYFDSYSIKSDRSIHALRDYMEDLKKAPFKRVVGYGAAAKGVMLLNVAKIGMEYLDYVVDSTPAKIGKYLPGVQVKVVPPEELGNPDYILLLARNFKSEIMNKHIGHRWWINPLPVIELIKGAE